MHRTVQPFTLPPIGKDATEAFEDVGHSDEARALLPGMLIGEFEKGANVSPTGPTLPVGYSPMCKSTCSPPVCQVKNAKSYQSTAAATAMENAVEQTSKFVRLLPHLTQLG